MYIVLAAGAVIYGCLMLAWRRPPLRSWIPRVSRERLREAGLLTALVTLALCAVALATNAPTPGRPWWSCQPPACSSRAHRHRPAS